MFNPSASESTHAEDLLEQLLREGRALSGKSSIRGDARIEAQQDLVAQRAIRQAQAMMERFAWRPTLAVAMVNRCTCQSCGQDSLHFEGYGVEMTRRNDGTKRIVATPALDQAYPRKTYFSHTITAACPECLPRLGFSLSEPL